MALDPYAYMSVNAVGPLLLQNILNPYTMQQFFHAISIAMKLPLFVMIGIIMK